MAEPSERGAAEPPPSAGDGHGAHGEESRGGALGAIVRAAFARPLVPILLVALGVAYGALRFEGLHRDVFPDLSAPIFNVILQSAAMGPEEVEQRISIPFETAFSGMPGVRRVRSIAQQGILQITVEFQPDVDFFRARQLVAERISQTLPMLPPGTEPPVVSSVAGRLNEVMELVVESDDPSVDGLQLRDVADFDLRQRLLAVPGVGAVDRVGGFMRELSVQLDPDRMRALDVSLDEVSHAVEQASVSVSGGVATEGEIEWAVSVRGRVERPSELGDTVIDVRDGVPVRLSDVATITEAPAFRRGVARHHGHEVVHVRIAKQIGADCVHVSAAVREALDALRPSLPPNIRVDVVYDQAQLVDDALGGVGRAIGLGAIFVVIVIWLLLRDLRSALLVAISIPTSIALAIGGLSIVGLGLDTMTLGGLAIAVGLLVDASIIVVENVAHRLADAKEHGTPAAHVVVLAAQEVARPILFATFVVIAVFVPLFGIQGVSGRLYGALAAAVVLAMGSSLVVALGVVPSLSRFMVGPGAGAGDGALIAGLKRVYAPLLGWAMRHAWLVRIGTLGLTVPALFLATQVGSDFVPELDEGCLMLETGVPPEASLATTDHLTQAVEDAALATPGVFDVIRRSGRGELTEDPMPHTNSDVLVVLARDHPQETEAIIEDIRGRVSALPGVQVLFTTPLQMRIDEGLGGSPADVAVRVFGPDVGMLATLSRRIRERLVHVRGLSDVRADSAGDSPVLQADLDRAALMRLGMRPGEVTDDVALALVGREVGRVYRGSRRFPIRVRVGAPGSATPESVRTLLVDTPLGGRVPLAEVADVRSTVGPSVIRREAGSRRATVEASVVGRDLVSTVEDVRRVVAGIALPSGYFTIVGGRIESQQEATAALAVAIGLALVLVLLLLYVALGSLAETLVILATLPDALVGGILALVISGETWNVSSLVGLLGLFGIAVQNGLVLVSQTRVLRERGKPFGAALREACLGRVRPKLMTASTAILGLLPLIVLRVRGAEIERPLAIVMAGGLVTSLAFTLLALPTFYQLVEDLRTRGSRNEPERPMKEGA